MSAALKTPALIDMSAYWLPYTPNRYFHQHPKVMQSAKGAYYYDDHGRKLFDGLSGLWCSPLGHADPRIGAAITKQYETMDYCPAFQMASEATFTLASRIAKMAPTGLDKVFFTNSGSEAVDTALKIAIGYHRVMGNASRTRMIGRDRAYHGVGVGGISVGGMVANRKMFASMMMPGVDHLPHTYNLSQMAFSKGQPSWGAHLADELEKIVALHDANTIAAVILEPVQGSTGVLVPPDGYLQKIREICTRHGILLIFDEVKTGLTAGPHGAAKRIGVKPDLICLAKSIGGGLPVAAFGGRKEIMDAISDGRMAHYGTFNANPLAMAGVRAMDMLCTPEAMANAEKLNYWLTANCIGPTMILIGCKETTQYSQS